MWKNVSNHHFLRGFYNFVLTSYKRVPSSLGYRKWKLSLKSTFMMVFGNYPLQKIEESYYSCHCACTMTVLATNMGGDKIRLTWLRKSSYTKNAWFSIKQIFWNNLIYMSIRSSPYWPGKITLLVIMNDKKWWLGSTFYPKVFINFQNYYLVICWFKESIE